MDMNFFFLNEDLKDLEKNLDRQLAVSKAVADHMKIKYNDILIQKTNIKENFDFPSSPISLIPNEDEEKADKEGLNENIRRSFLNKIN